MESTNTSALSRPIVYCRGADQRRGEAFKMPVWLRNLVRRYGIAILALAILWGDTTITRAITRHNTTIEVTERLTAQYDEEYDAKLQAYKNELAASRLVVGEASRRAAMEAEADSAARVIGPMKTKRMKLTMLWNMFARVDNPAYPNTVEGVAEQPQQWMFYDEKNPIREDDRQLVLEQLELWHDGRYPAGFSASFVYGEWSENDYVLRDSWDKNSSTNYWRFPE